jgi:hypothetical protein
VPPAFNTPTLRNLRADDEQYEACTAVRDEWLAAGDVDRVTTRLPKRGGAACMIAWQIGRAYPVDQVFVTPDGRIERLA